MFKFIIIILLIIILFTILFTFKNFYKIKLRYNLETVKYKFENISFLEKNKCDISFLEKNKCDVNLDKLIEGDLFYTTVPWNTTNFNYILFNDRYYIIEPGYYYHFIGKMVINNNILVNKINKDILNLI